MSKMDKMFHTNIRLEAKHSIYFHSDLAFEPSYKAYNPFCGDQFDFYLGMENGIIRDIQFSGHGCILSKASSSILCEIVKDKALQEALALSTSFYENVSKNEPIFQEPQSWFSNHEHDFDQRLDCITLSWTSFIAYIQKKL